MHHHISAALAHERIAEAVRRAETEMIGSLGTRRPHGSIEVPPFAASILRKAVRTRDSDLLDGEVR